MRGKRNIGRNKSGTSHMAYTGTAISHQRDQKGTSSIVKLVRPNFVISLRLGPRTTWFHLTWGEFDCSFGVIPDDPLCLGSELRARPYAEPSSRLFPPPSELSSTLFSRQHPLPRRCQPFSQFLQLSALSSSGSSLPLVPFSNTI